MAANRTVPDADSDPGGVTGTAYADNVRDEIEALWNGTINQCGTIAGTANAITAVCAPVLTAAYANGQTFRLTPTANNSSTVTINIDGRGAKALRSDAGVALAADDIVSGTPILFWYDAGADYFRLSSPSLESILSALAADIDEAAQWVKLGDTTVSVAVASIEHTFTAGAYAKVITVASGLSPASGSNTINCTLRKSGGAIVTVQAGAGSITAAAASELECEFLIDLVSATKRHCGLMWGYGSALVDDATGDGSDATAPDRIRWHYTTGNIDAGRVMTWGLKHT